MIAAGGGSLLFVFEGIYPLAGFRRVEKRFYYLTKCGHDFTILAGCGHDFTVLVIGTCGDGDMLFFIMTSYIKQ